MMIQNGIHWRRILMSFPYQCISWSQHLGFLSSSVQRFIRLFSVGRRRRRHCLILPIHPPNPMYSQSRPSWSRSPTQGGSFPVKPNLILRSFRFSGGNSMNMTYDIEPHMTIGISGMWQFLIWGLHALWRRTCGYADRPTWTMVRFPSPLKVKICLAVQRVCTLRKQRAHVTIPLSNINQR